MKKYHQEKTLPWYRRFSLVGAIRYFSLKLRGRRLVIRGACRQCGGCCKRLSLEGPRGWIREQREFEEICKRYPEYRRFTLSGKDTLGFLLFTCSCLGDDNRCLHYADRLPLCKAYPDQELFFIGGSLPRECGYRLEEIRDFDRIYGKALKKHEKS
jgi:Fe-S-cluster containining protein